MRFNESWLARAAVRRKKMQSKKKSTVHFTLDIMQIPQNSSVLITFPLDYLLILLGIDCCCSLLELLKVRT